MYTRVSFLVVAPIHWWTVSTN